MNLFEQRDKLEKEVNFFDVPNAMILGIAFTVVLVIALGILTLVVILLMKFPIVMGAVLFIATLPFLIAFLLYRNPRKKLAKVKKQIEETTETIEL